MLINKGIKIKLIKIKDIWSIKVIFFLYLLPIKQNREPINKDIKNVNR